MMRSFQVHRPAASLAAAAMLVVLLNACSKQTPEELLVAAQRHLAAHEYASARIELRNVIQATPDNGLAHELLGTTLLRMGDPVSAEPALRKALTLARPPEKVVPELAMALLRQGQAQKVIDEFNGIELHDRGAHAALRASIGHAWLARGDVKAASEDFAAAQVAQPGNAFALLGQARIAAQEERPDAAMALVDSALVNDPRLVEAHAFKGQLLMSLGRQREAREALEQALSVEAAYLPARLALASILIESKDFATAKKLLTAAGTSTQDPRLQAQQALLALRQGDMRSARDAVAAAMRGAPDDGATLALAGEIELRSGNFPLAEQYFGRSAALQPSAAARRLLATAQLREGRAAKALKTLEPLLRGKPLQNDAALLLLAGEVFLANGDVGRAGEYFESAKTAVATEVPARTRLGQLAMSAGDFERGEQELLTASGLGPQSVEPDLLLVSLYLRRQEPAKALVAANTFIKKQPQDPLGHVLAGTALMAQQHGPEARQCFEAALRLRPGHVPALAALAELDIAEGKAGNALKRFDTHLALRPNDEQLLLAMAGLEERTGRGDAAATLRKAAETNPRSREPVVALVQYYLRHKNAAQALEVARSAALNEPGDIELAVVLAAAQEANGAVKDAVRTLTAVATRDPSAVAPLTRLAQLQARQRDFDAAASTLTRAQERQPDDVGVARDLAGVYVQAAKIDRALMVAKNLQARRPQAAAGHALEGDVLALAKRWAEAERAYRAALNADPQARDAAAQVYRMLFALGRRKDADAFASDWIASHPSDATMRLLVADAAVRARNLAAAIDQYEAVLNVNPNQPLVMSSLASALAQVNDRRALGIAERAASLEPRDPDVLDALGRLYLQAGDPKKGLDILERARDLAPHRPDLRLSYAKGLLRNGRTQEGKAELRELAAVEGDFLGKTEIQALLKGM